MIYDLEWHDKASLATISKDIQVQIIIGILHALWTYMLDKLSFSEEAMV